MTLCYAGLDRCPFVCISGRSRAGLHRRIDIDQVALKGAADVFWLPLFPFLAGYFVSL
jgi:hypothetical protein